jgi:hypothetical protein
MQTPCHIVGAYFNRLILLLLLAFNMLGSAVLRRKGREKVDNKVPTFVLQGYPGG